MSSLLTSDESPFVFGAYVAHLNQPAKQPVDIEEQTVPVADDEPTPSVLDRLLG